MFLHHVFPQQGTKAYRAFQSAINDISKESTEVIVTNPILILTPSHANPNTKLSFLRGKDYFSSELNKGEAYVRQKHA